MKKILIIADCEFGDSVYYHLAHLIPALRGRKNFAVEVMLPSSSPLLQVLSTHKITTHQLEYEDTDTLSRADLKVIRNKLTEIKPDIVHTHSGLPDKISTVLSRFKTVHTLHSELVVPKWRTFFPLKYLFKPTKNAIAQRVIATNRFVLTSLQNMGANPKTLRNIYNGVAPARLLYGPEISKLRAHYNIPPNTFVVTYIASLETENGQNFVLDTVRELPYNVMTLIVCDGITDEEYEKHLRTRIQREELKNVQILPRSPLNEIFAITDVQISPTSRQTIPSHVLSGMSIGKPTIVNKRFDPFIIQDEETGLTFEPDSVEWLDDAITRIKDDKNMYNRLAEASKVRYAKYFTADIMAAETEKVYKELI